MPQAGDGLTWDRAPRCEQCGAPCAGGDATAKLLCSVECEHAWEVRVALDPEKAYSFDEGDTLDVQIDGQPAQKVRFNVAGHYTQAEVAEVIAAQLEGIDAYAHEGSIVIREKSLSYASFLVAKDAKDE